MLSNNKTNKIVTERIRHQLIQMYLSFVLEHILSRFSDTTNPFPLDILTNLNTFPPSTSNKKKKLTLDQVLPSSLHFFKARKLQINI